MSKPNTRTFALKLLLCVGLIAGTNLLSASSQALASGAQAPVQKGA